MKLAILGGSFNPVHNGHLLIAEHVRDELKADRVDFIPANIPPHKNIEPQIDDDHRLMMVQLAIQDHPQFGVSEIELERGGISYTIDTVRQIARNQDLEGKIYLIIGGDLIHDMYKWKNYNELLSLVQPVVVNREDHIGANYVSRYPNIHIVKSVAFHVTSTLIRERIREGKSIKYLVPNKVKKYIYTHKLYHP